MRKVNVYVNAYEKRYIDDYGCIKLGGWSPIEELKLKATYNGANYVLSADDYDYARRFFGPSYPYLEGYYEGTSANCPTWAEIIRGE